jgi:hypothetical protein
MTEAVSRLDLHIHTCVSDGTDRPEELLPIIREKGLDLFSVTDHDDIKACRVIRSLLKEGDPRFLSGVEFSCRDEMGRYHILGYGYDDNAESIHRVVEKGHAMRMTKFQARLDYVQKEFGFTFSEDEIRQLLSMDNPGKPHLGKLMVEHGYAESISQAIHKYINGLRIRDLFLKPEEAIESILNAGGIPVLAHPSYGDGDDLLIGEVLEERLKHVLAFGLQGVEAFYSGFTPKLRAEVLALAGKYNLYVTAGSDYHGSNKLVVLGDTGLDSCQKCPEGLTRFLAAIDMQRVVG